MKKLTLSQAQFRHENPPERPELDSDWLNYLASLSLYDLHALGTVLLDREGLTTIADDPDYQAELALRRCDRCDRCAGL